MEIFDVDTPNNKFLRKNVYYISKKLAWILLFGVVSVLIVLLVLTIYFGVKQRTSIGPINNHLFTTTFTITNSSSLPVVRIPNNLQPLVYNVTIEPHFNNRTFDGDLFYTFQCLYYTDQIILHAEKLIIDNSSIEIVHSSMNSIPVFVSQSYDSDNQLMKFLFSSMFIPKNIYIIHIVYTGRINQDLDNLYLNQYININGNQSMFMSSNMEPMGTRNMLPCIDEPARKAIFEISVIHNASYTPWSNREIQKQEELIDGRIISHFSPTLSMSTYLLGLIITPKTDFACLPDRIIDSTGTKSRVCGRTQILPQLTYADEVAYKTLEFLNTYFNISYPLPKIEHFDVIHFPGEAMEYYGLLVYDNLGIYFDEKTVSRSRKQYITTLIIHEIAHQWFGNLVTPVWWNELWLKEGFATYWETFVGSSVQPSMKFEEQFAIEKIFQFMEFDSLSNSHPMTVDLASSQTVIYQLYDSISYYKASAIIRMISKILGASTFQQGLQKYLKAFRFNSTTRHDLWKYLSEATTNHSINIEQILEGWVLQTGYPILEINRTENQLILNQKPFYLRSTTISNQNLWWIPFKYIDKSTDQHEIVWFNSSSMILSMNTSDSDWILANPDYLAVYRTKYDAHNFKLIVNQLFTNHTLIPTTNRAALIDDIFALSRAGLANISDAYALINYLKNETELVPWTMALAAINQQEILLGEHKSLTDIQQYFLELILPIYEQIGWTPLDQSTDWLYALLQPSILSTVCRYGHQHCIESARQFYQNWTRNPTDNSIPADLRVSVYCTIIRAGSRSEFDFLWSHLQNQTIASETLNLLEGLACTRDSSLILRFLDQHLENPSIIRAQDLIASIGRLARSPQANQIVWNWIRDNWPKLTQKWDQSGSSLRKLIDAVSSRFVTPRKRDELKLFADSIDAKGTLRQQFQSSIETINANIQWNTNNIPTIIDFLRTK